jgi:Na+/proline symporter
MVTIGDVLAVIGTVVATVVSMWAMVIAVSVLFGERTARARERIEQSPGKVTLLGGFIVLVLGIIVAALLNHPNGLLKLVGWVIYLLLLLTGAVGFSGLAALVAQRLKKMEPSLTPYGALSRGALFCVLATLVPLLGWFVVGPLMGFASVGAGVEALFTRSQALAPSPPANTTVA